MKVIAKFFLILATVAGVISGCAKQSDINDLQKQIDSLKSSDQIQTISGQITSINNSLTSLQNTDSQLKGYIETLQGQAESLETAGKNLEDAIAKMKEELKGEISAAESDAVKMMEEMKTAIDDELEAINKAIAALQVKDNDLQKQIDDLKVYADTQIGEIKDWAEATSATLEEYNKTAEIVAGIPAQIENLNNEIADVKEYASTVKSNLEEALNDLKTELQNETDEAVAALRKELLSKIENAGKDASTALETATEEITKAYKTAISEAIEASENSMRTWINEQLTGYYTIAEMDTRLGLLEDKLDAQKKDLKKLIDENAGVIEKNKGDIEKNTKAINDLESSVDENAEAISNLTDSLAAQKTAITTAYTAAIEAAVENQGTINKTVQDTLAKHNSRLIALDSKVTQCETDIAAIKDEISTIKNDIADLQKDVKGLLSRVQSVTYIPKYADGIERVEYDETATATDLTLRFDIRPADCADSIVLAYSKYLQNTTLASPLKARAVYTLTKAAAAGDFVDLTIKSVTAEKDESTNKSTGVLSVTVSPVSLGPEFFQGTLGASLVLSVSTGSTDIQSDYIRLAVSRVENSSSAEYYSTIPFTITSVGATSVALSRYVGWTETNTDVNIKLQYRKNSGGWTNYTVGNIISLSDTDTLQFRPGTSTGNSTFSSGKYYYKFKVGGEGKIIASGNAMSLLNRKLSVTKAPERCFYALFYDVDNLVSAANLQLPATELSAYCYANMFDGCTALVSAPKLPATKLADYCYSQMFESTALVRAPALPAKRLAVKCYYRMFYRCTSLTAAPSELPALDLASWTHCYLNMFQGCTALTSAPKLPATGLSESCYYSMFEGCTSLTAAPELNATTLADYCYKRMFYGCTSLTAAPELPAATLVTDCYRNMFYGCKNLNHVQAMFTNSPSYTWEDDGSTVWYTYGWLDGVAKEGTFVKNADATWDATGANAIPSGWTVLTE